MSASTNRSAQSRGGTASKQHFGRKKRVGDGFRVEVVAFACCAYTLSYFFSCDNKLTTGDVEGLSKHGNAARYLITLVKRHDWVGLVTDNLYGNVSLAVHLYQQMILYLSTVRVPSLCSYAWLYPIGTAILIGRQLRHMVASEYDQTHKSQFLNL